MKILMRTLLLAASAALTFVIQTVIFCSQRKARYQTVQEDERGRDADRQQVRAARLRSMRAGTR
jgi:hypothetical protein